MTSQEAVEKMVKSCIVSRKGGVPFAEIDDDYRELVGESIPYARLGYSSLQSFVRSIDYVEVKTNYLGNSVLFVSDPKVAHIDSLVRKQKNPSNQKKRNRRPRKRVASSPRSERFTKNTKMAYFNSKWYTSSNRTKKNDWLEKKNERRGMDRYNNYNAGRKGIENHTSTSPNFHSYNDRSWSTKPPASLSSNDENMYNFNSEGEKRYAEDYRSWRFNIRVADKKDVEVGKQQQQQQQQQQPPQPQPEPLREIQNQPSQSQFQSYNRPYADQQCGPAGPTNNGNNWWRGWDSCHCQSSYLVDNQSGYWWSTGQQFGSTNVPGSCFNPWYNYPAYPWWGNTYPQNSFMY